MCSNRCAKPVRPRRSFLLPTWNHSLTWTIGQLAVHVQDHVEPVGQGVVLELDLRHRRRRRGGALGGDRGRLGQQTEKKHGRDDGARRGSIHGLAS